MVFFPWLGLGERADVTPALEDVELEGDRARGGRFVGGLRREFEEATRSQWRVAAN